MRLKDRGDAYAEKVTNVSCDLDYVDIFEAYRTLFNEAIAEGRRNGIEEAIKMFEKDPNIACTKTLIVVLLKELAAKVTA